MLGKLLKYEIPAMGRRMLPLYAAWAVTALLLGLSLQTADSKSEIVSLLSSILYISVTAAIFVMTIMLIVQRYRNSLLGDEAYFNHVLPVTASEHIGNKLISASLWVFVTIVVAVLTMFLIGLGAIIVAGFQEGFDELMFNLRFMDIVTLPKYFGWYVFELLVLAVVSIVKMVMQIYAAVTIGHQVQNHTTLASFGAYVLTLMLESIVARMVMPFFNNNGYSMGEFAAFNMFFGSLVLVAVVLSVIYFFICKYLMENRLNLE